MQDSKIEWCDHTVNQRIGCSGISTGCDNCYAEAIEKRFGRNFAVIRKTKYYLSGELERFLKKIDPARIFGDSMFDYFHEQIPYNEISEDLEFFSRFPQHQFMLLTKRTGRAWDYCRKYEMPKNIWLGTSIENKATMWRLNVLKKTRTHNVKFVSFEPLLEDLGLVDLNGIDWAIVGGESGGKHRPFDLDWARNIRTSCGMSDTKFFFKQVGGFTFKSGGRLLDGKTYDAVPLPMSR